MRKINQHQSLFLSLLAKSGGSYCPPDDVTPEGLRFVSELVKAKRLSTEETDTGFRYHLTEQGWADARA